MLKKKEDTSMKKVLETPESQLIGLSLRLNPIDFDADKGLLNWDATETSLKEQQSLARVDPQKVCTSNTCCGEGIVSILLNPIDFLAFPTLFSSMYIYIYIYILINVKLFSRAQTSPSHTSYLKPIQNQ